MKTLPAYNRILLETQKFHIPCVFNTILVLMVNRKSPQNGLFFRILAIPFSHILLYISLLYLLNTVKRSTVKSQVAKERFLSRKILVNHAYLYNKAWYGISSVKNMNVFRFHRGYCIFIRS